MRSLDEVNPIISSIAEIYLELSFEDVLEAYDDLDVVLDGIEEDAVKIKNIYLLWVYIIEWLTVKAAALISGFMLWSTMVRRKLY